MPKNLIEDPSHWGADISDLVRVLNRIDIPVEFKLDIEAELEYITGMLGSGTAASWGNDI